MLKEFREFAIRGNVVDMAVGLIIGGSLRHHRDLAGERRHHAAHRAAAGRRGLREPLRRAEGGREGAGSLRHAGRREGRQRRDAQHRRLHQRDHQLHRSSRSPSSWWSRASTPRGAQPARRRRTGAHAEREVARPRSAICSRRASTDAAVVEEPAHARAAARDDGATGSGECGVGARLRNRRGLLRSEGDKPDLARGASVRQPQREPVRRRLGRVVHGRSPSLVSRASRAVPGRATRRGRRVRRQAHQIETRRRAGDRAQRRCRARGLVHAGVEVGMAVERPGERRSRWSSQCSCRRARWTRDVPAATKRSSARETIDDRPRHRVARVAGKRGWRPIRPAPHSGIAVRPRARSHGARRTRRRPERPRCRGSRDRV